MKSFKEYLNEANPKLDSNLQEAEDYLISQGYVRSEVEVPSFRHGGTDTVFEYNKKGQRKFITLYTEKANYGKSWEWDESWRIDPGSDVGRGLSSLKKAVSKL